MVAAIQIELLLIGNLILESVQKLQQSLQRHVDTIK